MILYLFLYFPIVYLFISSSLALTKVQTICTLQSCVFDFPFACILFLIVMSAQL